MNIDADAVDADVDVFLIGEINSLYHYITVINLDQLKFDRNGQLRNR